MCTHLYMFEAPPSSGIARRGVNRFLQGVSPECVSGSLLFRAITGRREQNGGMASKGREAIWMNSHILLRDPKKIKDWFYSVLSQGTDSWPAFCTTAIWGQNSCLSRLSCFCSVGLEKLIRMTVTSECIQLKRSQTWGCIVFWPACEITQGVLSALMQHNTLPHEIPTSKKMPSQRVTKSSQGHVTFVPLHLDYFSYHTSQSVAIVHSTVMLSSDP